MMRFRFRCAAFALALVLSGVPAPFAVAEQPIPEPPMVYCPTATEVSVVVGYPVDSTGITRDSCNYYNTKGGGVSFSFVESFGREYLPTFRASQERNGTPVVDVPELGAHAFSVENDGLTLYWNDADGRFHVLAASLASVELALTLANLFIAATGDPPVPTVPAKDFTLECPTAGQVAEVVGREVDVVTVDGIPCAFRDGDERISFSTVTGYGSIFEYRDRVRRDVSAYPNQQGVFSYFGGLTPGAFTTADLSPVSLRWQLEAGVVAQMTAREDTDVLRRLALMLTAAQAGTSSTTSVAPGKPGLPSTGD